MLPDSVLAFNKEPSTVSSAAIHTALTSRVHDSTVVPSLATLSRSGWAPGSVQGGGVGPGSMSSMVPMIHTGPAAFVARR